MRRAPAFPVNGEDVPLEPGFGFENLVCVSRDGDMLFG
jgi:hypothetical protein